MVAQIAWTNISTMASTPVSPCTSKVSPPAMSNIRPVPHVSQTRPIQKKTVCHTLSRPGNPLAPHADGVEDQGQGDDDGRRCSLNLP